MNVGKTKDAAFSYVAFFFVTGLVDVIFLISFSIFHISFKQKKTNRFVARKVATNGDAGGIEDCCLSIRS